MFALIPHQSVMVSLVLTSYQVVMDKNEIGRRALDMFSSIRLWINVAQDSFAAVKQPASQNWQTSYAYHSNLTSQKQPMQTSIYSL